MKPLIDHHNILDQISRVLSGRQWQELVTAIKTFCHKNPYENKSVQNLMWHEQSVINFPLLYVSAIYTYVSGQKNGCQVYLFASRDCCHLYKIFKKLFPHTKSYYFNCSRTMFESATNKKNKYYNRYVDSLTKDLIDKTMFIDVHGTGKRMFDYFSKNYKQVPYCLLLSATHKNYRHFPSICQKYHALGRLKNLVFDARGSPIEMLNYDSIGTLQNFSNDNKPIRDKLEYSHATIEPYHKCMSLITEKLLQYDDLDSLKVQNLEQLESIIGGIFQSIRTKYPVITKLIEHVKRHEGSTPS
jgi:hypothetical protein